MIGRLGSEADNKLTLRIPSHIAPRYHTQKDLIDIFFKKLLLSDPNLSTAYVQTNTEWDFKINVFSSKKIITAGSSSHLLE